jgi:Protein of unknown function (DUF3187)
MAALLPALAHAGEFLAMRNENPLLRGLYLPMPVESGSADGSSVSLTWALANTINVESRGAEQLFVDGEASMLRLSVDVPLAQALRVRVNLPLIRDSGGSLDSLIDRWHGWFGLPRGQRPNFPRYQLNYSYQGLTGVQMNRPHSGVGDAAAELGWYAVEDATRTLALWGGVEAPTGSAREFTGNGWRLGAEVGMLQPFGDAQFGGLARRTSVFGRAAANFEFTPAWAVTVQLEGQSARLKQTQLRFLGPSLLFSTGLQRRFGRQWTAQLGFAEDAAVNTAPDVTFFLNLTRVAVAH